MQPACNTETQKNCDQETDTYVLLNNQIPAESEPATSKKLSNPTTNNVVYAQIQPNSTLPKGAKNNNWLILFCSVSNSAFMWRHNIFLNVTIICIEDNIPIDIVMLNIIFHVFLVVNCLFVHANRCTVVIVIVKIAIDVRKQKFRHFFKNIDCTCKIGVLLKFSFDFCTCIRILYVPTIL